MTVKKPKPPSKLELRDLGDNRWALVYDGIVRHVSYDPEECVARGRLIEDEARGPDLVTQGRALYRAILHE